MAGHGSRPFWDEQIPVAAAADGPAVLPRQLRIARAFPIRDERLIAHKVIDLYIRMAGSSDFGVIRSPGNPALR